MNGRELWTSNGTAAGTVMVSTSNRTGLVTGPGDADIQNLTVVNDVVTFVANDGVLGREVWLSDGTTSGTFVAADFIPGTSSSNPSSLFGFNGNLIFSASNAETGAEPRSAVTAPKISIEQPVTVALPSNGSALVDVTPTAPVPFGTGPTASASLSFTIKNGGINNLRNVSALLSGLHASEFSIATKPLSVIPGSGSSTLVIKFTPKEGGERVARLTVLSSDPLIPSFVINLSGECTKETTVTSQPTSQFVKVGAPVTLSAAGTTTATTPLTIQWRRNGAAIAGAVTNPLYLWSAKLTDAGAYTAQFKSNTTTAGTGTSDAAQLSVVEDFSPARVQSGAATAKTTIDVKATSSGTAFPLRYQWKRSANSNLTSPESLVNSTPAAVTKYTNVTTPTLTITGAVEADSQFYFCEVRDVNNNMLVGGTTHLKVFSFPPQVDATQTMPHGIVSRFYSHQILLADNTIARTPLTFSATGLPPGLAVDTTTGLISGRPTKSGSYSSIVISATNKVTPLPVAITMNTVQILAMPTGLDGFYTGRVARDPNLNDGLGGRFELTVTKDTGAFSGHFIMGTLRLPFKGGLDIGITAGQSPTTATPYEATVTVPRPGFLAPITFTFTIDDVTKNHFSSGQVSVATSAGPVVAAVSGWKQIRKATPTAESAIAYAGLYNFGIRLPAQINSAANPNLSNLSVPQGNGYGSFTVAAAGTLTLAGRTPDGETLTGSTFVGPSGQVLFFQTLYTTVRKGSILGQLNLGLGTAPDPNDTTDNTLTSTVLDWVRPPNPAVVSAAVATRTYRAGFGLAGTPVVTPVELEAFGGRYVPPLTLLKITSPPTPTPVPTIANAEVKFNEGGVDVVAPPVVGSSPEPDITAAVTSTNTVVVISPNPNAAKTRITPTRTTGAISGGFTLINGNARTVAPLTPNPILRTATYQGLIVPDNVATTHEGVGYFMLPQLPNNTTLNTMTPILSGKMTFKKL
ncbi:MAG: hypothetical protein NTV80_22490 [Verrucomicrobia bacterium]|nr:hypothetical protein [Verrucomicrobiota bacterium]